MFTFIQSATKLSKKQAKKMANAKSVDEWFLILREPNKKRGPKPDIERLGIFEKAIEIQNKALKMSNKQALEEAYVESGMSGWKARQKIKDESLDKRLSEYKTRKIRN